MNKNSLFHSIKRRGAATEWSFRSGEQRKKKFLQGSDINYYTILICLALISHLTLPNYANAFSGHSNQDFLSTIISDIETDESFLNKARVDSSYFLADGMSTQSLLEGDGFLFVTLDTEWKKVEKGITITKSRQKYKGLEVFGGEMVARQDKVSTIHAGFLFKEINVNKTPKLSMNKAKTLIKQKFGENAEVDGKLGVLPTKSGSLLAYRFNVFKSLNEYYVVYMDANTGKFLRAYNRVDYFNAGNKSSIKIARALTEDNFRGLMQELNKTTDSQSSKMKTVPGSGKALNNKRVKIQVTNYGNTYALLDIERNIITLDAIGQFRTDPLGERTPDKKNDDAQMVVTQDSNEWNNKSAISAHHHADLILSFMREKLKRNSIDDNGLPIRSIVNAVLIQDGKRIVDNAFYVGEPFNIMVYLTGSWSGKKDAKTQIKDLFTGYFTGYFKNFAGALDIAAHEMAHGITYYTSNLEYLNESGAINESFSDMFGVAVEYFKDRENFDWGIGEDIVPVFNIAYQGGMRLLDYPKRRKQPDTYHGKYWYFGAEDQGGVHTNSGVGNKAFYLIANGGRHNGINVPKIGMEKAILTAYRANQLYMNTRSQYIDCARAFILAAKDLYGDEIAKKVYLAWKAVNLEVKGLLEEGDKEPQKQRGKSPEKKQRKPTPDKLPKSDDGFLEDML